MKITICGSLAFAQEIIDIQSRLEELSHEVSVPMELETFTVGRTNDWSDDLETNRHQMIEHYHNIAQADAILVTNFDKNNIKNYVGGATLVDMGIACYTNKKIFLLNPIPSEHEIKYVQEIKLMTPIIINGDLSLIQ